MQFSPGVLQHADARAGQRLSTVVELHELGAAPHLQGELEALRDAIAVQRRRPSLSLFVGWRANGQALAAASLGRAVGMPVLRIDLSAVISNYIGETEKNLDRVFADAEAANAILFFDEADALFEAHRDVHDAHDRYANVEVSSLLRKLETYPGPAILVTGSPTNVDPAFLQRVHHVLHFHTPLHPPKP